MVIIIAIVWNFA